MATNANTDPVSDQIEPPLKHVEHRCQRHKCDQRRDAAARQHTVIHLQHEKGAGEHQDIAQTAEDCQTPKYAAAGHKKSRDFGSRRVIICGQRRATVEQFPTYRFDQLFRPLNQNMHASNKDCHARHFDLFEISRRGEFPPPSKVSHSTQSPETMSSLGIAPEEIRHST